MADGAGRSASRSDPAAACSRSPATTATCSSSSRTAAIPVLGVEPARNIAAAAQARGIPTLNRFFGPEVVDEIVRRVRPRRRDRRQQRARPRAGDQSISSPPSRACLAPGGAAVFEFPYLGDLLERTAFDTIYHEHVFYYSLAAVAGLAARAGLEVFDVERQAIHGGSLRVFVQHAGARPVAPAVARLRAEEDAAGLTQAERATPGFSRDVARLCDGPGRPAPRACAGRAAGWPPTARRRRAPSC